ncbi:hypothetical protein KCM76_22530 [Zooshikella marina]|uniref:hypothetical protein n=1 Tax=Zooshikella ganghwensis TaxID=202772 RepID=UPI001BAEF943|nr:hypothetical protein [Zooshikella ganghwensis]MBU2708787.1 hypothetical protein [Zooshikella ganghwensis]
MRFLLITLSFLLCSACIPTPHKVYSGPDLPENATVLIADSVEEDFEGIDITCVDGESTRNGWGYDANNFSEHPASVIVLPGRRYIGTRYWGMNGSAYGHYWLDTKAGHKYLLRRELVGSYAVKVWIEDTSTGTVVGGITGGEPNKDPNAKTCIDFDY